MPWRQLGDWAINSSDRLHRASSAPSLTLQQRPCPEGFSLAKSPQEQAFTTKKVMILDRNHPYLPSHARGAQADSGQVAESAPPTASTPVPESPHAESAPPTAPTPPPESPQEQAFTTNQVMILTSNDWHPCLPSHTRGTQAAETAAETAAEPGVARRKRGGGDWKGSLPNRLAAARARSWRRCRHGTTARQRGRVGLGTNWFVTLGLWFVTFGSSRRSRRRIAVVA